MKNDPIEYATKPFLKVKKANMEAFLFKEVDLVPNSKLPALVYKGVVDFGDIGQIDAEQQLDILVTKNGWYRDWTHYVFPFLHYHSTSHECLVVFSGQATIQLGGKEGKKFEVSKGDMLVIPAGVGHERILQTTDLEQRKKEMESFTVFGIYPKGQKWDFISEDPQSGGEGSYDIKKAEVKLMALKNISAVPIPENDPIYGQEYLMKTWGEPQKPL